MKAAPRPARVKIPDHLTRFAVSLGAPGLAWLQRLPGLVEACTQHWSLTIGAPFPGPTISFVAPAVRADDAAVVLKVSFPDRETAHEADALRLLNGDGTVRLLAADPARHALLLEWLEPGMPLSEMVDEDQANRIASDLLRRFWRPLPPGHPFDRAADRAGEWAQSIVPEFLALGKPFKARLVEEAAVLFRELSVTREPPVLLHQDFHHGNILSARREPWLIIDPKPLAGERAFDAGALLRDRRHALATASDAAGIMARRLDLLADLLALDRTRIRDWGLAQAVELGLWSYKVGDIEEGNRLIRTAQLLQPESRRV